MYDDLENRISGLDYAYKHESNPNVRERILLIRRMFIKYSDILKLGTI